MPKRLTQEEFIKRAIKVHRDKYDYSQVEYISAHKKVKIICPIHGEFWQSPDSHIDKKSNCILCTIPIRSKKRSLSAEDFINKSINIHGNKYDYSKVDYKNNSTKVKIICSIHGEFLQSPRAHFQGGCRKCGFDSNKTIKNTEEFIVKANNKHGNKYDYSKIEFVDYCTKVKIICPKHGEFMQPPFCHTTYGYGCLPCSKESLRLTQDEFINISNEVHKRRYDYSQVKYEVSSIKVKIICSKHGVFEQTPGTHMKGAGCPKCGIKGIGEEKVMDFLIKLKVKFEPQKMFPGLKYIGQLKMDFYLPDLKICIEFDGEQHYKPVGIFGGEKRYEVQQKRDRAKNEFCSSNNIKMIRITQIKDIEPILTASLLF